MSLSEFAKAVSMIDDINKRLAVYNELDTELDSYIHAGSNFLLCDEWERTFEERESAEKKAKMAIRRLAKHIELDDRYYLNELSSDWIGSLQRVFIYMAGEIQKAGDSVKFINF